MAQGDGLGEVLVQAQGAGDSAADLRYLQGVGEAGAVVVAFRGDKHLGFMLQAPEGLAMDNPVAVALVCGTDGARLLRYGAAAGPAAQTRPMVQDYFFPLFSFLPQEHALFYLQYEM
jgi:hypothetical protein